MKGITWVLLVVGGVLWLVALVTWAPKLHGKQPCSEFAEDEVAGIPARCLKEFVK